MPKRSKKRPPPAAPSSPGVAPPDLDELLRDSGLRDAEAGRKRLDDLYGDNAELLALARMSGLLKDLLRACPDPDAALFHFGRFVAVRGSRLQLYRMFQDHPALLDRFVTIVAASRYLADILVRNPEYLDLLSDAAALSRPRPPEPLKEELTRLCGFLPSEEAKLDAIRRIHRREVFRIAAADLLGFQPLQDLTRQVSDLADVFVEQCLSILSDGSNREGLIVLALGKWGGRELNYSSDIDVLFLATPSGDVDEATRLAQRLIRALSEPTYEGVVYRVDVRLRPYGSEGTLVATTRMAEEYLKAKAYPAERQAMLKARAVAGDVAEGRRFLLSIVPVLLLDAPSARQQVRRLKSRIEKQLQERGQAEGHVKSAPGGIRDVEFLVQALQLESGPARPGVLDGNTLEAIRKLDQAGLLAPNDAQALRDAYVFLRNVEHRMQLMGNKQVYRLPRDEEDLRRLGRTLGFAGPDSGDRLLDAYDARTRRVRSIFDRVLSSAPPETGAADADAPTLETVRRQLGPATDRLDPDVVRRSAELLDAIRRPEDVKIFARQNDRRRWTVSVCAADQNGLLSMVTGLFAAHRINIRSGDCLRMRFEPGPETRRRAKKRTRSSVKPPPPQVTRKVLDVFEISLPKTVSRKFWDSFRDELADLAALIAAGKGEKAQEKIFNKAGEALLASSAAEGPLLPVRIEIRNDAAGETGLHIHSGDTFGFVFEFATTLAALRIDIVRAVIRTLDDEVYDTFLVTDLHGRKLDDPRAQDELRVAAALVKQFTHLLPRSPNPAQALRQFTALLRQMFARPEWVPQLRNLESPTVLATFAKLMGVSRFLWEDFLLLQHESLFPVVVNVPALDRVKTKGQREKELTRALAGCKGDADAAARLNEFKDREMFRIDLRHITRRSGFREFTSSLSDLAEVVVGRAGALCEKKLKARPSPWTIGALGKFGGRELGIASDLDLIFVYDDAGAGRGRRKPDPSAYFDAFIKALLKMLKAGRDGSFGIDLRLRPHGSGGAHATSLKAFEEYYSEKGPARQFERMALVKLNPVTGDPKFGARLVKARDAFVYSEKPLDYANILHLRRRQAAELVASGERNAKYSPGGLADVEYFVQARQIEAGHRDAAVRVPNTLDAIEQLVRGGHLRAKLLTELSSTYVFLRRLIDALRVVRGSAKDSVIPAADLPEFAYLVRRLDYTSPAQLEGEIRQRTTFARNLWNEVKFSSS